MQTFDTGITHPLFKRAAFNLADSATTFVHTHLSVDPSTVSYHSGFAGEAAHHAFLKQTHVCATLTMT